MMATYSFSTSTRNARNNLRSSSVWDTLGQTNQSAQSTTQQSNQAPPPPPQSNNGDFEKMYQELLNTFRSQGESQINSYRELLNTNNANDMERQRLQQANELDLMNTQYRNMAALAREQASDWLTNNSKLMSESSIYRSRESDQQYRQDRQMQTDKLGSDQLMQQRGFKQELDVIDSNERVDVRRRNSERQSAIDAYRRF